MLGPFYNNNENIRQREGNKQPIDLRSFPNPGDAVLTLIPIILRTGNPQQTKDKNYKVNLLILRRTVNSMPYNRLLIERNKVYVMAQPMPALETPKTLYFTGQNIL